MAELINYKLDDKEQIIRYYKKVKNELQLKVLKEPKRAPFYLEEIEKITKILKNETSNN
jgi:hypothetical protein